MKTTENVSPLFVLGIFIFSGLLALNAAQREESLDGKIKLAISLDETEFIAGTEQYLEVSINNLTNQYVFIPYPSADLSLKIIISDSQGDTLRRGRIVSTYGNSPKSTINPQQTFVIDEPLSFYSNMPEGKRTTPAGGTAILPGRYTISAVLGGVASNSLTIHILEPSQDEKEVATLFRDAASSRHSLDEGTTMVEELLRKYQSSVYAPNMYTRLGAMLGLYLTPEKVTKLKEVVLEGIDRFPNSQSSDLLITYYLLATRYSLGMGRDDRPTASQIAEIEGKLNLLKSKYPGTRTARYAGEQIEVLKK